MFNFFFFNDTATTEIYTLSLHDALPICAVPGRARASAPVVVADGGGPLAVVQPAELALEQVAKLLGDRKSTRLNSSHANISYAVFCLKKKKNTTPKTSLVIHI